jgi:hypothetical protein
MKKEELDKFLAQVKDANSYSLVESYKMYCEKGRFRTQDEQEAIRLLRLEIIDRMENPSELLPIRNIIKHLERHLSAIKTTIDYEKEKENADAISLLQEEWLRVHSALYALKEGI